MPPQILVLDEADRILDMVRAAQRCACWHAVMYMLCYAVLRCA